MQTQHQTFLLNHLLIFDCMLTSVLHSPDLNNFWKMFKTLILVFFACPTIIKGTFVDFFKDFIHFSHFIHQLKLLIVVNC